MPSPGEVAVTVMVNVTESPIGAGLSDEISTPVVSDCPMVRVPDTKLMV